MITPSFTIEAAGNTDIGRVRSTNQDSYLVDKQKNLFIVADGMGGHAGGEIASLMCIDFISRYLQEQLFSQIKAQKLSDPTILTTLSQAVNFASTKIYEKALEEPLLKGMGTTATTLFLEGSTAYWAHVGDSRLYLLRCGFIYQLTNDHSLVSEQVRAGLLSKEDAELHYLKNVITRSVGYQEEEDVDVMSLALEAGDMFLLCSDGLHGKVADIDLSRTCQDLGVAAVDRLISLANERGGEDNVTLIAVRIQVGENRADNKS